MFNIKRSYPEATDKELYEEVYCELLGKYVYGADDAFIKRMAGENPSLLQRIIDHLKQLFDKTTDKEMAKELQSIIEKADEAIRAINKDKVANAANHGYNNSTEVIENGRGFGNEEVGRSVAPEGGSPRYTSGSNNAHSIRGERYEDARMANGESQNVAKANDTKGYGDKPWDVSKLSLTRGRKYRIV